MSEYPRSQTHDDRVQDYDCEMPRRLLTTRGPTMSEMRRAASEWCQVMDRHVDYVWFMQNWTSPELQPYVEREML